MLHDQALLLAGPARETSSHHSSRRAPGPVRSARTKASPEQVLRCFNTWSFKREQPSNPGLLRRFVADAIAHEQPIAFVLYWGKGPRRHIADPDLQCLDYLAELVRRVASAYEHGTAITLIFTDTHARLNGHSEDSMNSYFHEVELAARKRGMTTCTLGELISGIESPVASEPESTVSNETLGLLIASAAKWYRGKGNAEDGARRYYQLNMVEKRAVERAFPGTIFITFNGSALRCLVPDELPIFYMHSLRRGISVKPWFIP